MPALSLYYDTYACTGPAGEQAPALVLLHGWGLHAVVWDPVVPALLQHWQVTVIDLPGMGRSPMPAGDYDLDYLVEQVARVAPPQAAWLAWSLGGTVAIALAHRYPQRVTALGLVACNPCFVQREDWSAAMPASVFSKFSDHFDEDWDGTLIRFLSLQCRGSVRMREDIRFLQEILYLQGLPALRALRAGLRILAETDLRVEFAALTMPVALMLGAQDHLVPAAAGTALAQRLPGLRLAVIEGSGHAPFLAQPELFLQACDDALHA